MAHGLVWGLDNNCGSWIGVWGLDIFALHSTCLDNPSLRNLLCDDKLVAFVKTDLNHGQKRHASEVLLGGC